MCLAVPAKLISVKGLDAVADLQGNRMPVSLILSPDAQVGDWILLHAGFAIQRLNALDAEKTYSILKKLKRENRDGSEEHSAEKEAGRS